MVEKKNKQSGSDPIPYSGRPRRGMSYAHRRRIAQAEEKSTCNAYCRDFKFPMKNISSINFIKVGSGHLALFHRPKNVDFPVLHKMRCKHVVTLLKESEGAEHFGNLTKKTGMEWVWLAVPNGKYPKGEVHRLLLEAMLQLSQLLDEGKSILIHCSAGIHRTGTVAYGLLRWRGLSREQAMKLIGKICKETADGMMEKRMRGGDENAHLAPQQDIKWLYFVREFVNQLKMQLSRLR